MKFLADENFPIDSVIALRNAGHDVDSIQESAPGLQDIGVLERAVSSNCILLTFDRDFGDLIFNHQLPAPAGVVYFRFDPLIPNEPAGLLLQLMEKVDIDGNLTVVSTRSIRQRPLPKLKN